MSVGDGRPTEEQACFAVRNLRMFGRGVDHPRENDRPRRNRRPSCPPEVQAFTNYRAESDSLEQLPR